MTDNNLVTIENSMNVAKVLQKLKKPPLTKILALLSEQGHRSYIFEDSISLWSESYSFYYLTLSRLLPEMSLAKRVHNAKLIQGTYIQIPNEIAKKYNDSIKYLLLDFVNFSLHTRILLDRTISLARYFISGRSTPSFTSFNNHRKFFLLPENTPYQSHDKYAKYIREKTEWFDNLKLIRDKYIVHTQLTHYKVLGFKVKSDKKDVVLTVGITEWSKDNGLLSKVEWIHIDVMEIVSHVSKFLSFFDTYATNAIEK